MPKIKIAYLIDTIESPTCGTEKQLLLLIKALNQYNSIFEPYLCCLRSSEWLENEFDLCPLHVIGIESFKNPVSYYRILRFSHFLKRGGFNIVQTFFRDANIVGILCARFAGIKVIISSIRSQGYWHTNGFELFITKILNRLVTHFIVNSESTKVWAREVGHIPKEKIQVIYNGIDIKPYREVSKKTIENYRESFDINDHSPAIGIVANLRPVKGLDIFLMAAKLVKKEVPASRFIIVGDGEERDRLKRLSNELGLEDSVRFLGKREDVVNIVNALDIGVLSSYSESLSNSVIEYLAAGLPVVCTNAGGCDELVEAGVNGFLVPKGDYQTMAKSLLRIMMDKDLASDMARKNRQKAEDVFSNTTFLKLYRKFYQEVFKDRPSID
ncbi:MAG: glycosyltransferase [bacterium]